MDLYAFLRCFLNLIFGGRHFLARFQTHQMNFQSAESQSHSSDIHQFVHYNLEFTVAKLVGHNGRTESRERLFLLPAQRTARHIDGNISAPDDSDPLAYREAIAKID